MLQRGANEVGRVQVTLAFLVTSKTFVRTGIMSEFGPQLVAAYLTKVFLNIYFFKIGT